MTDFLTDKTGSLNKIYRFPEGGRINLALAVGPLEKYNLTGKYAVFRIRKSRTEQATLFRVSTASGNITLTDPGEATQKAMVSIGWDDESELSDGATLGAAIGENRNFEFGVDFQADAEAELDFRIQGAMVVIDNAGPFSED